MIVFESANLRIEDRTLTNDTSRVVVTFPARTDRQGLDRKGFGEDFLLKNNISSIFIKASENHWFQIDELYYALEKINNITKRFNRIITYGSSMGGFGAIIASKTLSADLAIAISPQFSIERTDVPFEKRWAKEAAILNFSHKLSFDSVNQNQDLILIYDPTGPDRPHAQLISKIHGNTQHLVVPFGGHPAGAFLRDTRLISPLLKKLISGSYSLKEERNNIRVSRKESGVYWANMASALRRRHSKIALEAAARAVKLAPDNPGVLFQSGRLLNIFKRYDEAFAHLFICASQRPNVAKFQAELGSSLLGMKKFDEAEAAFKKAASLGKQEDPAIKRGLLAISRERLKN